MVTCVCVSECFLDDVPNISVPAAGGVIVTH
jgi:hypothetical protein